MTHMIDEQSQIRREKLTALRADGFRYPNGFSPSHTASALHQQYQEDSKEHLEQLSHQVSVAGRMLTRRVMGKATFMTLRDRSGDIQIYARKNDLGEASYDRIKHGDLGDIYAITGVVFRTQKGELSIHASSSDLLAKSLHGLPEKYHGIQNVEMCYRQRYLDLMVNQETRARFIMRSQIIQAIRQFLTQQDFLEVETPMMHGLAGGATAKPFETHHNALNIPLYLRVAPELHLKRLVVGGFERVFEINRNFRNEGLSTKHNPEFTMIEFYQAYATYHDLMDMTEALFKVVAQASLQGETVLDLGEYQIDFAKGFARLTMLEAIASYCDGVQADELDNEAVVRELAHKHRIAQAKDASKGVLQLALFESLVEPKLQQPTFITRYPREVSPLARVCDDHPEYTDRFELFINGMEVANGFSELNDPDDQRERFMQQMQQKAQGDEEAMPFDEDYITALEYGLPPTAGEGIGIDRLVMLFSQQSSIRDVILFPLMRPHQPMTQASEGEASTT